MTISADESSATLLKQKLLRLHYEWNDRLQLDPSGERPVLILASPHCAGHELSVRICATEATVSYSDGVPPGPAEALFIWGDGAVSDGIDTVCGYIESLVDGRVLLVRERLSRFTQLIRGRDCDSLLWFAGINEFGRWPQRRKDRVATAWAWDGSRF